MGKAKQNVAASVRARLQNLSRETRQSFDLILTRYTLERLLYRLSTSVYAERFVLKGAMLLTSWFEDPHRATRDLDLLARRRNLWVDSELFSLFALLKGSI